MAIKSATTEQALYEPGTPFRWLYRPKQCLRCVTLEAEAERYLSMLEDLGAKYSALVMTVVEMKRDGFVVPPSNHPVPQPKSTDESDYEAAEKEQELTYGNYD